MGGDGLLAHGVAQFVGRQGLADVAEVGGGSAALAAGKRLVQWESGELGIVQQQTGDHGVGPDVLVERVVLLHLQTAAGHGGSPFSSVQNPAHYDIIQVVAVAATEHEIGGGVFRHNVGRSAAVGNHPVDTCVLPEVLAQRVYAGEEVDHAVQRVDALMGHGSGVGGLAVEDVPEPHHGQTPAFVHGNLGGYDRPIRRRVRGQHGVHPLEHPTVQHPNLATAAFFSRGADDHHLAG